MKKLPILKAGDSVEIIAPASRCSDQQLIALKNLLISWNLDCILNENIFGNDLLCANSDELRFKLLKNAFHNPKTKAIICARGGYGSMRLIPQLMTISPPVEPKLFVGMSDITALNLFLQQKWQWPTIHGALNQDKFSAESIATLKALLFGEINYVEFTGIPLNLLAKQDRVIDASITGGNLCLVQTSIGTAWQLNGKDKIIFLEEIAERGYRIDRMLEHLEQANILHDAAAIVLGDFLDGKEPDGSSLVQPVLERFAKDHTVPVVQVNGIGHGYINFPLFLGKNATLHLGKDIKLIC